MKRVNDSIVYNVKECAGCGSTVGLQKHHCLHGTANRRLADQDGLWVWLCDSCHRDVHDHASALDDDLKIAAEYAWIKNNNSNVDGFIARYGKNYFYKEV